MDNRDDGEIASLDGEKINSSTGQSEGGAGRLVILKQPVTIDVLEKRVKSHLKLSQSGCQASFFSIFCLAWCGWLLMPLLFTPGFNFSYAFLPTALHARLTDCALLFSPGWLSFAADIRIDYCPVHRHLCGVRWVHVGWKGGRCLPYGRDVACMSAVPSPIIWVSTHDAGIQHEVLAAVAAGKHVILCE